MDALIGSALEAGAWGSCLAGAGPTILAISSAGKAEDVAAALKDKAHGLKVPGRSLVLDFASTGAKVEPLT